MVTGLDMCEMGKAAILRGKMFRFSGHVVVFITKKSLCLIRVQREITATVILHKENAAKNLMVPGTEED